MAKQFTGANAVVAYKPELVNGLLATIAAASGKTTLGENVDPGHSGTILCKDVSNFSDGDTLEIGSAENREIVKIKKVKSSDKTITLVDGTLPNFRHTDGEAVQKIKIPGGFVAVANIVDITPRGERGLENSRALGGGVRALAGAVPGRYEFGADLTLELDIDLSLIWFLHALNADYESVGTDADTELKDKLKSAVSPGDTELELKGNTNFTAGDYLQIGKEVVQVKAQSNKKVTLVYGLRHAHAADAEASKKQAPFTHTIKKGSELPAGLSLLLCLAESGQESLILLTGCRINTLSLSAQGSTAIPTLSVNLVAARGQTLAENLFGDPDKPPHAPLAQWELDISLGAAANRLDSFSLEIANNISATAPLGTPLPGDVTVGEGSLSGSFEYEYRTQEFAQAVARGTEREMILKFSKTGGGTVTIKLPRTRMGGTIHPGVSDKGPIPDSKTFTAFLDPDTGTDIEIVATTGNPVI